MHVDVHAHAFSDECLDEMTRHTDFRQGMGKAENGAYHIPSYGPLDRGAYDLELQLRAMDDLGTDLQLISPPMVPGQPTSMTVEQARWINAHTASWPS